MRKNILVILAILILTVPVQAFELDWSVDDEIRDKYQPSKLEQEVLPGLPSILKQESTSSKPTKTYTSTTTNSASTPPRETIDTNFSTGVHKVQKSSNDSFTTIMLKKGTKFNVQSRTNVSDRSSIGARMTFVTTTPVVQRYVSIPAGTTIKGIIEDSHQPNGGGNGGLIKIKADSVVINGTPRFIDGKITKANNKKIFLNNIKGKRGYCRGIKNTVAKGQDFYDKSRSMSNNLSRNPFGTILAPIPTIVGGAGYTVNLVTSPITALWSKGDHISIPAGSNYVIKLRENTYME